MWPGQIGIIYYCIIILLFKLLRVSRVTIIIVLIVKSKTFCLFCCNLKVTGNCYCTCPVTKRNKNFETVSLKCTLYTVHTFIYSFIKPNQFHDALFFTPQKHYYQYPHLKLYLKLIFS